MGTEPCFDVAHRDAAVEGSKRSGQRCGRVALHEDDIRGFALEDGVEPFENTGCEARQGLVRAHNVHIEVGDHAEAREHAVQEAAVLGGDADADAELLGPATQLKGQRRQFNGLRPGSKDEEDLDHGALRSRKESGGGGKNLSREYRRLLVAVADAAFGEIVGRHLHRHTVAGENADAVAPEFTCQMCQYHPFLIELHTEQPARVFFDDRPGHLNAIFFTHRPPV